MRRTPRDLEEGEHVPGQLPLPVGPSILSLFSGYGGLDMAVAGVLGGHVVAHAEVDPAACRVLEARFPGVPNLGDVTAVDWPTVGPVDVIAAGFPCQDVSAGGLRIGLRPGTRSGLWSQVVAAIDACRPALIVIENVRGLLSARAAHPSHSDVESCPWCMGVAEPEPLRALGAVLGDLSDLGYDAAWRTVRAADVGAAHGRARVFVVAWPAAADTGSETGRLGPGLRARRQTGVGRGRPDDGDRPATADADRGRREGLEGASPGRHRIRADVRGHPDRCGSIAAADPQGDGRNEGWAESAGLVGRPDAAERGTARAAEWGRYTAAVGRWAAVLGRDAPSPLEAGNRTERQLSPAFVEWLQGLPSGWVTAVDGVSRNAALRLLGNGVVPQQAAHALRLLLPHVPAPPVLEVEAGGAA